jgi:hypothetical protein
VCVRIGHRAYFGKSGASEPTGPPQPTTE